MLIHRKHLTVSNEPGKFEWVNQVPWPHVIMDPFIFFCFPFPNSRTGQTQSQYLNFGDSQTEGKADAEITRYGSRASVCE